MLEIFLIAGYETICNQLINMLKDRVCEFILTVIFFEQKLFEAKMNSFGRWVKQHYVGFFQVLVWKWKKEKIIYMINGLK